MDEEQCSTMVGGGEVDLIGQIGNTPGNLFKAFAKVDASHFNVDQDVERLLVFCRAFIVSSTDYGRFGHNLIRLPPEVLTKLYGILSGQESMVRGSSSRMS